MRGRAINSRFMLYQDRLQSRDTDDYQEVREHRRIRRRYEGRETEADRQARQEMFDLAKQQSDEDLQADSKTPKFIRLYDVETRPSSSKVTTQLVRYQLRSCAAPEDFTRVFSVLLDTRPGMPNADGNGAKLLANETTQRIVAHSLARYDARRALISLSLLIRRLEENKQEVDSSILGLALIISAKTHSFVALRRYIRMSVGRAHEEDNVGGTLLYRLSPEIVEGLRSGFKHSPGQSKVVDALQAILYGPVPTNARDRTQYLRQYVLRRFDAFANWVNLLADCGLAKRLTEEWKYVLENVVKKKGRAVNEVMQADALPRLFIHAFFRAGSATDAWAIFEQHGSIIASNDDEIWDQLIENIDHKPDLPEHLQQMLESMVADRLDKMLQDIERNMGIAWVPGKEGEEGHHDVSASDKRTSADTEEAKEQERERDSSSDVKAFTQFAIERKEEILAQKDDILAGRDPRPYKAPFG